jgi:hypothetical protein
MLGTPGHAPQPGAYSVLPTVLSFGPCPSKCDCLCVTTECESGEDSKGLRDKWGLASACVLCHWFSRVPEMVSRLQGAD